MKRVSVETLEAISLNNYEVNNNPNHPDFVDTSKMTCKCGKCQKGYLISLPDGTESCNYCNFKL